MKLFRMLTKTKDLSNADLNLRFQNLFMFTVIGLGAAIAHQGEFVLFMILFLLPAVSLHFLMRAGIEILVRIRAGEKDF